MVVVDAGVDDGHGLAHALDGKALGVVGLPHLRRVDLRDVRVDAGLHRDVGVDAGYAGHRAQPGHVRGIGGHGDGVEHLAEVTRDRGVDARTRDALPERRVRGAQGGGLLAYLTGGACSRRGVARVQRGRAGERRRSGELDDHPRRRRGGVIRCGGRRRGERDEQRQWRRQSHHCSGSTY